MSISALMKAMADAGAPMEAIILAIQAIEARDAEIETRRAGDRERKRRQRDKVRDELVDVNVTGQSRDIPGTVTEPPSLSLPLNENNSNSPTHTHPDNTPRARRGDFPKPDWADAQVWSDLLINRKTKHLPCTATAHAKLLRDVDKLSAETGWPPGECLRACVARGWGAIFDPREKQNGRGNQNFGRTADRRDGIARALDRQLGLEPPDDGRGAGGSREAGGGTVAYLAALR